jgi:hypothetical protein
MQADTSLWNLGFVPHEKSDWGPVKAAQLDTDQLRRGLLYDHAFASWARQNDDPQGPRPPKIFGDAIHSTPTSGLPPAQGPSTSSPCLPASVTPVSQVTPAQSTSRHSLPALATVTPSQRLSTSAAQVPSAQPQPTPAPPIAPAQPASTQPAPTPGGKSRGRKSRGSKSRGGKPQGGGPQGGGPQGGGPPSGGPRSSRTRGGKAGGAPMGGGGSAGASMPPGGGAPMGGGSTGASMPPGGGQGKRGIDCVANQDQDDDHKSKKRSPPEVPKVQVEAGPFVEIEVAAWGAPTVVEDQTRFDTSDGGGIYELTVSMLTMIFFVY